MNPDDKIKILLKLYYRQGDLFISRREYQESRWNSLPEFVFYGFDGQYRANDLCTKNGPVQIINRYERKNLELCFNSLLSEELIAQSHSFKIPGSLNKNTIIYSLSEKGKEFILPIATIETILNLNKRAS